MELFFIINNFIQKSLIVWANVLIGSPDVEKIFEYRQQTANINY